MVVAFTVASIVMEVVLSVDSAVVVAVVVVDVQGEEEEDGYWPSTRKKKPGMLAGPSCWIPHGKRCNEV